MKKVIWFVEKIIKVNQWDAKNLSWHYYPIAKRESREGRCKTNIELGFSKEQKHFWIRKTAKKRTVISVYSNSAVEAIFLSGHELFHYLMATGQLKGKSWKNTEYFANIFGLIVLMKFFKEVGMIEECSNCGSTNVVIKYKLRSQFFAVVDLANLTVLESPQLEKIEDGGPQEFLVVCEDCSEEIEVDDQQKDYILDLMSVYDFGLMR